LLLGGRLDERVELADLALEQRELLLEDGLLRAPLGPELILLALEARPLLRERVDLTDRVGRFLGAAGPRDRCEQEDKETPRFSCPLSPLFALVEPA